MKETLLEDPSSNFISLYLVANVIESISAKDVVSLLSDEIGGRGGGREDFAQGAGESKNIQEFVTSIANSVKSLAK